MNHRPVWCLASAWVLVCALGAQCAAAVGDAGSLADLSLEELSNVQITSVSKRAEPLSDAAASVFVITADDIRRSGARRLPEALRLAPNLQVAQISSTAYAISAGDERVIVCHFTSLRWLPVFGARKFHLRLRTDSA